MIYKINNFTRLGTGKVQIKSDNASAAMQSSTAILFYAYAGAEKNLIP